MTSVLRCIVLLNLAILLNSWRTDIRPIKFGDSIPMHALFPLNNEKVRKKIVFYHNYYRSRVSPPAANMLKLKWHKGAANAADRWAHKCQALTHDSVTGRHIEEYGACGQNIFIATHKVPWHFAIKLWYLEKLNFTYGGEKNDLNVIGHFTQMVWASTHEVGCGFAKCQMVDKKNKTVPYFSYVCNYCPIGNKPGQIGRPYKKGARCSSCEGHCSSGRLCTNSCPVADKWANCEELYSKWPKWLCKTSRKAKCRATCTCQGRIK